MNTGPTKPEWDTPPDGDFARYVERLTAPAPFSRGSAEAGSPGATSPGQVAAGRPRSGPQAAVSPELAQAMLPLLGVVRAVRIVLLVLIALHAIALLVFSQGSLPGLVVMAVIWWTLGWLMEAAPKALSSAATPATHRVEPLQERLRQVAQQRKTGKKK